MSRFGVVFLELKTGEHSAGDQRRRSESIARCARAISSSLSEGCQGAGRLIRLAIDYRQTMGELESRDEAALRELKIRRADFRSIVWSEARRSHDPKKALNVTAPLQR